MARNEGVEAESGETESLSAHLHESAKLFEQPLLGIIGVAALIFGFIGYRQYFRSQPGTPSGWVDVLYADMQLLKLTSKVTTGSAPWTLNVGRLMAPLVTGYAAFRGVTALHRERIDRIRLQRSRGHTVVVGATPAALAVARSLRRDDRRVVVIDAGLTGEQALSLRTIGIFTVTGDAHRPEVLRQASALSAAEVLALTDDDALNIDVALRTRGRGRTMAAVSRADLCELLRIEALGANGVPKLDFLNAAELSARMIETTFPDGLVSGPGDLLIAAPAILASQLLARAARDPTADRPGVIVIGTDAAQAVALAKQRASKVSERLRITIDERAIGEQSAGGDDEPIAGLADVSRAVVGGDGIEAVAIALAVARQLRPGARVVLAIPDPTHLAPLLAAGGATRTVPIDVVDAISWWTDPELVLGGTMEVVARATHANYVQTRRKAGDSGDGDPSMLPWAQLPEHLKQSNRDQARHLWTKLAAVDCSLAPACGRGDHFAFTSEEVERLAELEHDRWVDERRRDGWTAGPRDPANKRTPHLVAWDQLSDEVKDLDRAVARGLPAFMADVGYEIVRNPRPARPR